MNIKINHPMADTISIIDNDKYGSLIRAQAGKGSCEIAFFKNGDWVTDVIPEFSDYVDSYVSDTRIYCWVPNNLIDEFLDKFKNRW